MKRIPMLITMLAFCNALMADQAETQPPAGGGASLENQSLRVTAVPGQPTVVLQVKTAAGIAQRAEIAILAPGAAHSAPLSKAQVVEDQSGEQVLRVTAGTAQAEMTLGEGLFVKINPGTSAASVEVRADTRYVALPDFFADDVVFDPLKFTAASLSVPAENFLLQFIEGGDSMLMCIWPGNLKLPGHGGAAASGGKAVKDGPDPQVDLVFAGKGKTRRVSATRIEFQNKPVYVGILEHKGIWHDQDAAGLPGYKPTPIAWKRPFEARWRGDFIVAEGKSLADWPTRNQSFDFKSTTSPRTVRWWDRGTDPLDARFAAATSNPRPEKWWERGDENAPQIWQESLASFFLYPAVLKGDEVRLCLYADRDKRNKLRQGRAEGGKSGKKTSHAASTHVYERVIIYPLERLPATPLAVFTPVDLMRETLGTGPCEYVLDLAGVKPQPAGGDRPILSYATCGLWNDHIAPITHRFKKRPDGSFDPLDEKTKTHLIQAIEEMWYFVHAVHDRLREYRTWGPTWPRSAPGVGQECRGQAAGRKGHGAYQAAQHGHRPAPFRRSRFGGLLEGADTRADRAGKAGPVRGGCRHRPDSRPGQRTGRAGLALPPVREGPAAGDFAARQRRCRGPPLRRRGPRPLPSNAPQHAPERRILDRQAPSPNVRLG